MYVFSTLSSSVFHSPYRKKLIELPERVNACLWESGFPRNQADGELLWELVITDIQVPGDILSSDFGNDLVKKTVDWSALVQEPLEVSTAKQTILSLLAGAKGGKPTSAYSNLELSWATHDRAEDLGQFQPRQDLLLLAKKWRHWKPRSGSPAPAPTQRASEVTLRDIWLERLLAPFFTK